MTDGLPALLDYAKILRNMADSLEQMARPDAYTPYKSIVDDLPQNVAPNHPDFVSRGWQQWPERDPSEIKGITIHHTLSHSPLATAKYCTDPYGKGGKGYPSIQYHFWVSQGDGAPVYLCALLSWALWHDHTGAFPVTISVGMAGSLHLQRPPDEQLRSAARITRWLMDRFNIPIENVKGHRDRYPTICPGWDATGWRDDFYALLAEFDAG